MFESSGRTVALALMAQGVERRRGVIRSRALYLNETGIAEYDAITLEHNGVAALAGFEQPSAQAILEGLDRRDDWDELFVGALGDSARADWLTASREHDLSPSIRWEKPSYFVDLDKVREADGSYLDSLSANTRYQIRRAMRAYEARGRLALEQASSLAEALDWLHELSILHQTYWRRKGSAGAFSSEFARRFHHAVVNRGWPRKTVEVVRLSAGRDVLGYLYNFRKGRHLCNYQAGMRYEADAKLKPGLVAHALVAEDARVRGLARYDLLMGGAEYKQRLANAAETMTWAVLQKRRLLLRVESAVRNAKARFVHGRDGEASGSGEAR